MKQLNGREIGVLSCLEDGVHAARLKIMIAEDKHGKYVVPVRTRHGIAVPYHQPISDLAAKLAARLCPDNDAFQGWQLLWGNGLALRRLLNLNTRNFDGAPDRPVDTVVQTEEGWFLVPSDRPDDFPGVDIEEADLQKLDRHLAGVHHRIIEGPAWEATASNMRLGYFLQNRVATHARTLAMDVLEKHLVAHGCAVYQDRRNKKRQTYKDQLPQLRLAVRRD